MEVALRYRRTVECNLDLSFKKGNSVSANSANPLAAFFFSSLLHIDITEVALLGGQNDVPLGAFHNSNELTLLL